MSAEGAGQTVAEPRGEAGGIGARGAAVEAADAAASEGGAAQGRAEGVAINVEAGEVISERYCLLPVNLQASVNAAQNGRIWATICREGQKKSIAYPHAYNECLLSVDFHRIWRRCRRR